MNDPRLADHATGLELCIEESVALQRWAEREGWTGMVHALEAEIADLYLELAATAEQLAGVRFRPAIIHGADTAEHLVNSSHQR